MRRRVPWNKEGSTASGAWIITYVDLCTLLLTFFVLLVSMSSLDHARRDRALHSLEGSLGIGLDRTTGGRFHPQGGNNKSAAPAPHTLSVESFRDLNRKHHLDAALIERQRDKIVIRIDAAVLFARGTDEIVPEMGEYLGMLALYLSEHEREIEIQGHTDSYERGRDQTWPEQSWSLSATRAQAVYDFFLNHGIKAQRMSSHGFSFHHPISGSEKTAAADIRNARVEILVGPNENIPSKLRQKQESTPYYNYKNFFFKLFPTTEGEGKAGSKLP